MKLKKIKDIFRIVVESLKVAPVMTTILIVVSAVLGLLPLASVMLAASLLCFRTISVAESNRFDSGLITVNEKATPTIPAAPKQINEIIFS